MNEVVQTPRRRETELRRRVQNLLPDPARKVIWKSILKMAEEAMHDGIGSQEEAVEVLRKLAKNDPPVFAMQAVAAKPQAADKLRKKFGQKMLGQLVITPRAGSWPGGLGYITEVYSDAHEKSHGISFQVESADDYAGNIGIIAHEEIVVLSLQGYDEPERSDGSDDE